MTRVAALTTTGHVFFELLAGVGMPLASWLGPVPAASVWSAGTAMVWRRAGRAPAARDGAFAVLNAVALAACLAHLAAWPRRRSRAGLPWLVDCEGLGPEMMPAYNLLIYGGGVSAVAALIKENRTASWVPPMVTLWSVPALVALQHHEFDRLRRQAQLRPAWWNRRLVAGR